MTALTDFDVLTSPAQDCPGSPSRRDPPRRAAPSRLRVAAGREDPCGPTGTIRRPSNRRSMGTRMGDAQAEQRLHRAACLNSSPRMFVCARCRCQAVVCRSCDRGRIYCGRHCATEARREQQREARRRYQSTDRGRALHVERSRRYRERQRVTDHTCQPPDHADLVPATAVAPIVDSRIIPAAGSARLVLLSHKTQNTVCYWIIMRKLW